MDALEQSDKPSVVIPILFALLVLTSAYIEFTGDRAAVQIGRSLVFVGAVALGVDQTRRSRDPFALLAGALLISPGGYGTFLELTGRDGFGTLAVSVPILVGGALTFCSSR